MRRILLRAGCALATLAATGTASAASHKYALAMFHFNIQYVAGGTVGFWPAPNPDFDKSAEYIEDLIVTESFEPIVDLFLAHPTWGVDLEMQGYMLDVIAARHPGVLAKMKTLGAAGRVEYVSFHYSDQLFIAHPREDWRRSAELTRATFQKYGVPLSGAVFCQEGQAGPGMADAMKAEGYTTLVWPKNLFSFQLGDTPPPDPLYKFGEVSMLTSREVTWASGSDTVDLTWSFVDDGETLASDGLDPYIVPEFKKNAAAVAKYEAELTALESQGFTIGNVTEYAAAIAPVVSPKDAPPLLDGTWQPKSTDGTFTWLGHGGLHTPDERDDDVQSLATLAHRELMAAESITQVAGLDAKAELDAAWRLLALGEVSDGVGINPFRGEVEYAIGHMTEILRIAREVIGRAKVALGQQSVAIDTAAGTAKPEEAPAAAQDATDPPLVPIVDAGDRPVTTGWTKAGPSHWILTVNVGTGLGRKVSVELPGTPGDLVYTPGLLEAPVHVARGGFVFDHFDLALTDGLIGLGGGLYVVEDEGRGHVGARITPNGGNVLFHSETEPPDEEVTWVLHVLQGDEATAAAFARGLNVTPKVWR